jgi:hypothetical protein
MAKARPLRTAARKPQAKAAKSSTRGAPDRGTAPARAPNAAVRTHAQAVAPKPVTAPVRQVATTPQPVVPPPLPAPIASFTF